MSFPTSLSPSPVHLAFTGIQWDPLGKLELSATEKSLLRSAEDNVLDYALAEQEDAAAYARLLLKVLDQVIGPSNPSDKVAKLSLEDVLDDEEALQMLYVDPMGVVSHYALSKLYEVILFLKDKGSKTPVKMSIFSTFYKNGVLIEEWRPLLRILKGGGTGDAYAQRGSALCLSCILFEGCPSQQKKVVSQDSKSAVMEAMQALVSWIASRLQSSTSTCLSLVTPALTVLVAAPEARKLFDQAGGIGYLVRHLRVRQAGPKKNSASVQQLYELSFVLWIMTYECNTSEEMKSHFHRDQAVAALVDLVATAPREKVVRVALSSLRNLATCSAESLFNAGATSSRAVDGSTFLGEMIGCGLIKSIDLMKERQWTDPDIVEDLDVLYKMLHENYHDMTRWDVYQTEVDSGHLQWGIVHTEKFFKENAKRMEGKDGNFAVVKVLISLAASSEQDEEVAAIACYDIGEFVRNYPNGRAIVKRLGAKEIIMKLIEHDNPELQRHALQCVSKMLVNNWQAVK